MLNEFEYYCPSKISEVFEILENNDNTALLAGGTDLLVDMKEDLCHPQNIIDIKNIPELKKLELSNEGLFIGAAVTCNQLLDHQEIKDRYSLLAEGVGVLGSHQIRNRATIVGNICSSSPGADTPPVLLTLGTNVIIEGPSGEREIPLENFFTGVKDNVLADNEIVTGLKVQPSAEDGRGKYIRKTRVKGPDLSACGVAGYISPGKKKVCFGYGAVAPTPKLIEASDLFFEEDNNQEEALDKLLKRVEETVSPITDVRSTKKYRRRVARVYTKRIFHELWEEGE